ncbi:MAG: rane protein [Actinomycetota bacterium]
MSKKKKNAATRNDRTQQQMAEEPLGAALLAPVAGLVLLTVAAVNSLRDRSKNEDNGYVPPSQTDAAKPPPEDKGIKAKLARIPVLGVAIKVNDRYGELKGNNLAASVAFQSFVSIFPLMLVIVAILGFLAAGSVDVTGKIVSNLGLTGEAAKIIGNAVSAASKNKGATAPIGLLGLFWSGLGLVNAIQYALDQVWQVEDRGMKDKAFGLMWLTGAAVLFVGSAAVTTVINWLPGFAAPLGILAGLVVSFGLWLWTFRVLPNRTLPWKALVPGALLGAVGMEVLKVVGAVYVPRTVANSSALYGSLGVVFAVLAWLLLFSRLVLYAAVLNVIRWERQEGTVKTTIEVPAGKGIQPSDDIGRSGRVEREDAAA